jgi:hypothetical protein
LLPEPGAALFEDIVGPLAGHHHRQDFVTVDDVEVLARYPDGQPAVTGRDHGAGRAIHFGTHFDVATNLGEDSEHGQVWANLARLAGVQLPFVLANRARLDGHLLQRGAERLLIIVNHDAEEASSTVCLPAIDSDRSITNLLTQEGLAARVESEGLSFEITVPGWDGIALLIE